LNGFFFFGATTFHPPIPPQGPMLFVCLLQLPSHPAVLHLLVSFLRSRQSITAPDFSRPRVQYFLAIFPSRGFDLPTGAPRQESLVLITPPRKTGRRGSPWTPGAQLFFSRSLFHPFLVVDSYIPFFWCACRSCPRYFAFSHRVLSSLWSLCLFDQGLDQKRRDLIPSFFFLAEASSDWRPPFTFAPPSHQSKWRCWSGPRLAGKRGAHIVPLFPPGNNRSTVYMILVETEL